MREPRTARGGWRIRAAEPALAASALELVQRELARGASGGRACSFEGAPAWLELNVLRGTARLRAALAGSVLVAQAPRLDWLRARVFLAPRPLAAGVRLRGALPALEFLLCEDPARSESLEAFLARRGEPLRAAVLDELARELARLDSLHGAPRAVCGRSVRIERDAAHGRVWFLERSRGAPRSSVRDLAQRLALEPAERERFAAVLAEERAAQSPRR